jgi:trigger factor
VAVSKEITRLERSGVELTVTVSKEEVRTQYDELLSGYSKTLQVRGFRKGKVPREVLERKFGPSLREEALGRIIENALKEILEDENLPAADKPLPYSQPKLQGTPALNPDEDLRFSVTYDVFPVVKVETWKGLSVEIPDAAVTDEDIDRELENIRIRNAIVQDREEDAAAETGDVVTVNYLELSESGEPLDETKREDFVFTLGSGYNMYRFDEEMTGMKQGETRDFEKIYPADFTDRELAGRTVRLRVSLTGLKSRILPEPDDDFAQDVDEKCRTLEDLRADIRKRFTENLDRRLRDISVNRLLEKIMELTPVELPESMIQMEVASRWRNMARQFQTTEEGLLKLLGESGKTYDDMAAEWRSAAIQTLHSRLIVEALMEEQNVTVTDEDLEREFADLAEDSGMSLDEVKGYYKKDSMQEYLKQEIKDRKIFELMLAETTVTRGKQEAYLDLVQQ